MDLQKLIIKNNNFQFKSHVFFCEINFYSNHLTILLSTRSPVLPGSAYYPNVFFALNFT